MHLAADVVGPTPEQVFEPEDPEHDSVVVIVTELEDSPGWSVTDAIRETAAGLLLDFRLRAGGELDPVFIEHRENGQWWILEEGGRELRAVSDRRAGNATVRGGP